MRIPASAWRDATRLIQTPQYAVVRKMTRASLVMSRHVSIPLRLRSMMRRGYPAQRCWAEELSRDCHSAAWTSSHRFSPEHKELWPA